MVSDGDTPSESETKEEVSIEEGEEDVELSDQDQSVNRNIIDPTNFPTLELTLEEVRRRYDDEEARRDTVENKISIVVTVDALLISFGTLFNQGYRPLALGAILIPALVSAGLGLYAIRSRDYERPGKEIWDFYDYSEFNDVDAQREQLLLDYVKTTGVNKEKNKYKFKSLDLCTLLTFISITLLLITPLMDFFIVFELIWGVGRFLIDFTIDWVL